MMDIKKIITVLFSILIVFETFPATAQGINKNSKRPDLFYYGFSGGGNVAILQGTYGTLRKAYIDDFVTYLKDDGYNASGSLNPRIGFNAGVTGGYNFAKRFAIEGRLGYSQRGFKESLNYEYSDTTYNIKYASSVAAHLDYIDFSLGIRYKHYTGISVFLGFLSSLNVVDKVYQNMDYEITYPNLPVATLTVNQDSVLFIHQYYGANRKIYMPAYAWGIGYSSKKYLDFNFTIEKSSKIFANDQSVDPSFVTLKLNVTFRLDYFTGYKRGFYH